MLATIQEADLHDPKRNLRSEFFNKLDTDNHSLYDHLYGDDFKSGEHNKRMEGVARLKFEEPSQARALLNQARKHADDKQSFESSTISLSIVTADIGVYNYLKKKTVKDSGFLMDRDGRISDPYILLVNDMLEEFYEDIFSRKAEYFDRVY